MAPAWPCSSTAVMAVQFAQVAIQASMCGWAYADPSAPAPQPTHTGSMRRGRQRHARCSNAPGPQPAASWRPAAAAPPVSAATPLQTAPCRPPAAPLPAACTATRQPQEGAHSVGGAGRSTVHCSAAHERLAVCSTAGVRCRMHPAGTRVAVAAVAARPALHSCLSLLPLVRRAGCLLLLPPVSL